MIVIRYAEGSEFGSKGENARALVDTEKGTREILLFKKPTAISLSHEISHFSLGQMDKVSEEDDVRSYISDEVAAWIDTYRKLKRPRHLISRLRGLVSYAVGSRELNYRQALYLVGKELRQEGVPKAWRSDFEKIESEVKLLEGGN